MYLCRLYTVEIHSKALVPFKAFSWKSLHQPITNIQRSLNSITLNLRYFSNKITVSLLSNQKDYEFETSIQRKTFR